MRPSPTLLLATALLATTAGPLTGRAQTPAATEKREPRDDARATDDKPAQPAKPAVVVQPLEAKPNAPEANRGREIQAGTPWSKEERRLMADIVENLSDSISLASVAGPLAGRPEVRAYAERVEREQRPVNREFTERARMMEAQPPGAESSQRRAARLADQRGAELDRSYVQRSHEINQETCDLLKRLEETTEDSDLRTIITRVRPLIEDQTRTSGQLATDM